MEYNPNYVSCRAILSKDEKESLHALAEQYSLERFRKDSRNFEEMAVDFVYTSAKIEGNTYDRIDTDNLLRLGVTAGGKRYSDAVMLLNLRDAFHFVMSEDPWQPNTDSICNLHKVLMKDLLPAGEQGIGRIDQVRIGASTYKPLSSPARLREEFKFIFSVAQKYTDPFERAIYLHCNLAYLQYFKDGNKRTSRMIQTAVLAQADVLPLFFSDTLIDKYQRATVNYYETGDYSPYIAFFKENYELAINSLLGISTEDCDQQNKSWPIFRP
jgi:Fic family protein